MAVRHILNLTMQDFESGGLLGELLTDLIQQFATIPRDELRKILALAMRINLCAADKVIPAQKDLILALDLFTEMAGHTYEDMTLGGLLLDLYKILVITTIPRVVLNQIWELTLRVYLCETDVVIPARRDLLFARDLFGEISTHTGVDGSDVQRIIDELIARQTMAIIARIEAE
jgi:hypothetical protein